MWDTRLAKKWRIMNWLDRVKWNEKGLVVAIAQEASTRRVLMVAWMNRESLALTVKTGFAHYWSRSRDKLWMKGQESGHLQPVKSLRLDCDGDAVVMQVKQVGGIACHTRRESCFYMSLDLKHKNWTIVDATLENSDTIYCKD